MTFSGCLKIYTLVYNFFIFSRFFLTKFLLICECCWCRCVLSAVVAVHVVVIILDWWWWWLWCLVLVTFFHSP